MYRIFTDKMTVIFDRNGMKLDKSDLNFVMTLVPIFLKNYPESLSKSVFVPKNPMITMLFKMFCASLNPKTAQKMQLRNGPECLLEIIDRFNILERFGGTLKDPFDHSSSHNGQMDETKEGKDVNSESNEEHKVIIEELWVAPPDILLDD